jgi:signal transduction histidine kinase/CheY-like chemotaxis protein
MPHGYCFEWRPAVLWLHVLSDAGIAFSYFCIALALFYFVGKRPGLPFKPLFWLFGAFIALCGTTHALAIWVLWHPNYFIEGYVKAATAIISVVTLITLARVLPRVLIAAQSLETMIATRNEELADANRKLREQIKSRESIEMVLRQTQKMQAVGQLSGGIAHDFNNMLQAIGGNLELARRRLDQGRADEADRFLQGAGDTVGRASALTNRLLAFARLQPLMPQPVNLSRLVFGMQELINSTVTHESAPINLEITMRHGDWLAYCDPHQLENALLNLIINARDAMPAGGTLSVTTHQRSLSAAELAAHDKAVPGDYVELEVADTGAGMDEETVSRVFEPFFTTKPTGRGTGLGLSMVYGFINQSGGMIAIESRVGKGTKVKLFLKKSRGAEQETAERALLPPLINTAAAVLVVEDEPLVRAALTDYMRDVGYEVLEAGDAAEALELVGKAERLDILVTDVGLPNGMNGRQLADAVRDLRPGLPVLLITGFVGKAEVSELAPAMKIVGKPYALPELVAEIASMVAGWPRALTPPSAHPERQPLPR